MPLTDCAPVIVAAKRGHAEQEGLRLSLERESSWAALRDRITVGLLDAAHMLAPMPIAANLGLTPLSVPFVTPLSLGYGGNTVTVSSMLAESLVAAGAPLDFDAAGSARAMKKVVADRAARGQRRLVFAIVHPHSVHNYQLAYLLGAAGIEPGRDVEFLVVPPPFMPAALAEKQIDGFCVGEPWGSVAFAHRNGRILTTGTHMWGASLEKVLGVRRDFAEANRERVDKLVRAVQRAAEWCDQPENRKELAELLARSDCLAQPADVVQSGLDRRLAGLKGDVIEAPPAFMSFAAGAATFPWLSQAGWLYAQMVRWGQIEHSAANLRAACSSYRPDIAREALAPLGVTLPLADSKVEGASSEPMVVPATTGELVLPPAKFFDGQSFDMARIDELLASYAAARRG